MHVYAPMDQRLPLRDVAAFAARVEALGYHGLLVPEAVHDGFLVAMRALEHTSRLRVATSVVVAFARSPVNVAYAAWDLQALSGGRFELGLGSQVRENLEGRFGIDWKPPIPRMREYVRALRAVWDCWQHGTPLHLPGPHYPLRRMQPFFRPEPLEHPGIPIHLAAIGPGMARLAGECADVLVTHPTNTSPRFLQERLLPQLEAGARSAGREGRAALLAGGFVATGPDPTGVAAERARIREYLGFLYSTPAYAPTLELYGVVELGEHLRALARAGRWSEMGAQIPDELLDAVAPCAPYAEIADVLREWYGGLVAALTFPLPSDPTHDARVRRAVTALEAA